MFEELNQKIKTLSFNRAKQQAFLEDVTSLIADGVPAPQAISAIVKTAHAEAKEVAQSILSAFAAGKTMADGMVEWFPDHIVALVRSGENSGTLTTALQAAAQSLAQREATVSSLLSSLVYPSVVLLLACVVAIFLKHSIFNNFLTIKPLQLWPENGKLFMVFATIIEDWWWAIILCGVGLIFFITQLLQKSYGEVRMVLDDYFPFSLYRKHAAARFMEILGLLISNGISFKDSLNIVQENSNPYLTWHIYMMQLRLSSGRDNIAEVLDTGLVEDDDMARLLVIAQGKGLEYALMKLGAHAVEKNHKQMVLTGRILGGIFLALDAGIAIFMILAVYNVGMGLTGSGF